MSKGKLSGGGIRGNKNVKVGVKGGKRTLDAISLEAVTGLGTRTAFPKPPLVKSTPNDFVPMGNTLAASCKAGPGGGRTLYGQSGSQSQHGKPSPGEGRMEAILGEPKSKV